MVAAVPSANSFGCTGKTITVTGTEFTKASTAGMEDFNAAEALINAGDFLMDTIVCNPIQKRDIKNLPNYSLYREEISRLLRSRFRCWANGSFAGVTLSLPAQSLPLYWQELDRLP